MTRVEKKGMGKVIVLLSCFLLPWLGCAKKDGLASFFPVPFGLISPSNNSTNISLTPMLQWNDTTGETSYDVEVATDSSFTNVVYSQTGLAADTTSHQVASALNASTTYYWRVIAKNSVGSTIASNAPFSFTVNPPSAFSLISPEKAKGGVGGYSYF